MPASKLVINPDCGLRHLPAEVARAKLRAMVAGASQVRAELRPPAPRQAPARRATGTSTVKSAPAAR